MTRTGVTYLTLADALETEVATLEPGTRLPSEHELAATHAVSRITARAALQELEQRHAVRRSRGSGTYVALRMEYPIRAGATPSWSQLVESSGHKPSYETLSVETVRASVPVARKLLLSRGRSVVRIERLGFVDGDVALHQLMCLPAALVPGLEPNLERYGSLATTFAEAYGMQPERWWSRAELTTVTPEVAAMLELIGRPPTWRTESLNVCRQLRRPIEYTRSWMRADCFQVCLEFGDPDRPLTDLEWDDDQA